MGRMARLLGALGLLLTLVTATPVRAAGGYFNVSVSDPYPGQYSTETVLVALCADYNCTQPLSGYPVHTVWNYRTSTPSADGVTGSDGVARISRYVSGATCGFTVRVDVFAGTNQSQIDSAYFTPCGGSSAAVSPSSTAPYQYQFYQPDDCDLAYMTNGVVSPRFASNGAQPNPVPCPYRFPSSPAATVDPYPSYGGCLPGTHCDTGP